MPLGMSSLTSRLRTCFLDLNYEYITEKYRLVYDRIYYVFVVVNRL